MSLRFDVAAHPGALAYKLLAGLVVPRPIALVTTIDAAGVVNAAYAHHFGLAGRTAVGLEDFQCAGHLAQFVTGIGASDLLLQIAFGHGALYGVLATLIALLAGLAIGLVFQSKGAH